MEDSFCTSEFGFVDAHIEDLELQAQRVLNTFWSDCPSFKAFRAKVITACREENVLGNRNHPVALLLSYTYSVESICWQVLYSTERLAMLSGWVALPGGQSSLISYYISHYFYGLIAWAKTLTDVLGLMMNHIFDLGIEREQCGLDRGVIARRLSSKVDGIDNAPQHIGCLYRNLDRVRNDWVGDFYKLRNAVTHRNEIRSLAVSIKYSDENMTGHPFVISGHQDDMALVNLFKSIAPNSVVMGVSIDPLLFCEELWRKQVGLIECVGNGCYPQVDVFVSSFRGN